MPTRRQLLAGFANVCVGAGMIASNAFGGETTSPSADFRIVVPRKRGFELRPGRQDESYVETDGDGLVTAIVLPPLSKGAITRFEDVIEFHKLPPGPPIDEIYLAFEVHDEDLDPANDPTPSDIQDALFVAAADGDVPGDGSQNYLEETDVGDAHNDLLSPNQSVPFGVGVDLLPPGIEDLPDPARFSVQLDITAEHLPQGPPGGNGPP